MKSMRLLALAAVAVGTGLPQPPSTVSPTFDVVSIKPHPLAAGVMVTHKHGGQIRAFGNRFTSGSATLQDLIMDAYDAMAFQITGLPGWAQNDTPVGEHFDIVATLSDAEMNGDGPAVSSDQLRLKLWSLLADRFQLKVHQGTKELPVYALVSGSGASKLRLIGDDGVSSPRAPGTSRGSIHDILFSLSVWLDRPVIDRTGLPDTGTYEYPNLDLAQAIQERRSDPTAPAASLFFEVRDKLGLKLEGRKEGVTTFVVDSAERPSAN